ncbi:MAG: tetratricopeptide repeat protein [Candidatus Eremiobacterota bacterium]
MKNVLGEAVRIIKEKQNKNINACINELTGSYTVPSLCEKRLKLTDKQKSAIIMVSMPPEISTRVMKEFSKDDVQAIASEIAILPYIASDIRNSVIEEFLDNCAYLEKHNWPYLINNRIISDYTAGDYRIYFNPGEKKLRIAIAREWALNLIFTDGNEFLFHIISPTSKLLYSKNKMEKDYIIKFAFGFYSAVLAVSKEKLFFMVFDIRKFNIEKDLLLVYSGNDFRLYINREFSSEINASPVLIKELDKEEMFASEEYNGKENLIEEEKTEGSFFRENDDYCADMEYDDNGYDVDMWIDRMIARYKAGDYEGAIKCCDEALEIDPNDTIAITKKAAILYGKGDFQEALKYYNKALDIDPDDYHALLGKVSLLSDLNRSDEAIFFCNRFLVINPDNMQAQLVKAKCLFVMGRYEEAIMLCNEVLSVNREDIRFSFIKAISKDREDKKYSGEEENIKYLEEAEKKYIEELNIKQMEQDMIEQDQKEEKEIKLLSMECCVSPEKGKKIHFICNLCGLSPDGAKILLEENDYDERKTLRNMMKENDLKERISYVCKRTKISEEEALKVLEERYYDEIEAVMSIKKEKRRKKKEIAEKNKAAEKNISKFNRKVKKILSFVKDNLKNVSLFLFSIKGKFTAGEK